MDIPYQRPFGSRRFGGIDSFNIFDETDLRSPAETARPSLPASVVIRISAGERAPSIFSRSISASAEAVIKLTLVPVASANISRAGLISASFLAEYTLSSDP
tara:strand:+ start:226 stop:531 length:306 start_codon:yes stop_codon:yes gene_type:complete